jgi:hypothetical protein
LYPAELGAANEDPILTPFSQMEVVASQRTIVVHAIGST